MCKGAPSGLGWSVLSVLLITLCSAAPGQPQAHREENSMATVTSPFHSKEESQGLLRSYIDSILNKEDQGRPEINSWEQEVFFLLRLHDYDHSGFLDGLEMIKLLEDFNAFLNPGVVHSNKEVVSVVDSLLQTQDLNHDGLFSPSELLSPPSLTQHEGTVQDMTEGSPNEEQVEVETHPQLEEGTDEDSPVDEQHVPQEEQYERTAEDAPVVEPRDPEAQNTPLTGQATVHQGQPEI